MTPADLVAEARSWTGTPWVHQASCKGSGADCIGFIAGAAANAGSADARRFLATPEWRSYGRDPNPAFMFAVCDELMDRIAIADATVGDVLIFFCGDRRPLHFGLITEPGKMIHNWLTARRVCEHQLDAGWRARIVRAYRVRGMA